MKSVWAQADIKIPQYSTGNHLLCLEKALHVLLIKSRALILEPQTTSFPKINLYVVNIFAKIKPFLPKGTIAI